MLTPVEGGTETGGTETGELIGGGGPGGRKPKLTKIVKYDFCSRMVNRNPLKFMSNGSSPLILHATNHFIQVPGQTQMSVTIQGVGPPLAWPPAADHSDSRTSKAAAAAAAPP